MHLNDKVIIITGGCQGLGRFAAEYFASKDAHLALMALNQEKSRRGGSRLPGPWCASQGLFVRHGE